MATTLNNINEDLLFYHELKQYIWPNLTKRLDEHNIEMVKNGLVQIETLLELAISRLGNLKIDHQWGRDFADGSDAKKVTSSFRNNNIIKGQWTNSYQVRNYKTKTGTLRVMGWNRFANRFDYYVIPNRAFQHLTGPALEIVLDSFTGYYNEPSPTGRSSYSKWNVYKVKDFYQLATKK